jgi:hypothetical protein
LPTEKLLFVDANIWLDFYRARGDAGLSLLKRVEKLSGLIVVSFQLESEFKRNRQVVLLEGMKALPDLPALTRPGMLSDAASTRALGKNLKEAARRVKALKARLIRAMQKPAQYDPVYQSCQRIFHKQDNLCLTLTHEDRHAVRERAARRHALGFPPRKKTDTSMGDAHNWEWMIQCAKCRKADLVIVTRDSDYGIQFENKPYLNDHLAQEFHERVGKRRKLILVNSLSEALKLFSVKVPKREVRAEAEIHRDLRPEEVVRTGARWPQEIGLGDFGNVATTDERRLLEAPDADVPIAE